MAKKRYAVLGLTGAVAAFGASSVGAPAGASSAPNANNKAEVYFGTAAACVGRNAVSTHEVFVDGKSVGWGLNKTMIQGGSTVKVTFTVKPGCDPTAFGLAVYSNPVDTADPTYQDVDKQTYATSKTITLSGGQQGSLEINLPAINDCFYQIDFFTGPVITKFGQSGQNYYGSPEDRLISAQHIEKPNCVEVGETSTTRAPTTSTTAPTTTSTIAGGGTTTSTTSSTTSTTANVGSNEVTTTTTRPAEVLNNETTNTTVGGAQGGANEATTATTQPAEVLAEELAATGNNSTGLTSLAAAFVLAGGALGIAASAMRRRRNASSGQ